VGDVIAGVYFFDAEVKVHHLPSSIVHERVVVDDIRPRVLAVNENPYIGGVRQRQKGKTRAQDRSLQEIMFVHGIGLLMYLRCWNGRRGEKMNLIWYWEPASPF
jgi:hypothetical protein